MLGDPAKEGLFVKAESSGRLQERAPHPSQARNTDRHLGRILRWARGRGRSRQGSTANARKFFAFDPGLAHYAREEEETVVQLSSSGSWSIN
jgi:hypothetical protein